MWPAIGPVTHSSDSIDECVKIAIASVFIELRENALFMPDRLEST